MKVSRTAFRHRRNFALALASEGAGLLLRGVASAWARGTPTEPSSWRRGLIIGHSHIGDVLYRTCSLDQLKTGLPACRWDYLTTPSAAVVLQNNPAIASVLPLGVDDDKPSLAREAFGLLREANYDVVLCSNTVRPVRDFALAAALGIPNRVGIGNKGYSGLLTTPVWMEYPQAGPAYFRAIVSAVLNAAPDWPLRPRVFSSAMDRSRATECLRGLSLDASLPTIACTMTTRQKVGAWPPSFFASVLKRAVTERPANLVLFGAAGDGALLRQMARDLPSTTRVVAGALDWLGFAEALRHCDALLAMDSGPRHLANAVGTPVLFARNLAVSRFETGTYCENETDLAPSLAEYLNGAEVSALVQTVSVRHAAALLLGLLSRRS